MSQPQFRFKPLGRKLLIRKTGKINITGGTIIQADTINVPLLGLVIDAGVGEVNEASGLYTETTVKTGENVVFLESAAAEIKSHGEDLYLLQENAVLGTFEYVETENTAN